MSFTASIFLCLFNWSQRYYLTVISVVLMYLLFLVISHLVFLQVLCMICCCVMVSFSNYCTMCPWSTIFLLNCYSRSYRNKVVISDNIIVLTFSCLSLTNTSCCSSSLFSLNGSLLSTGMMPLIELLLLIVHLFKLMYASTCPLLWWCNDDNTACWMFRILKNLLNLSEIKLPPVLW